MRRAGLDVVGEVPWGTHFCQFYQTSQDLLDVLVGYFRHGLEDNEFCMWITSEPLGVKDARRALGQAVPDLDERERRGQIEVLDYRQWYAIDGVFDADRVLRGWVEKERAALERGYEGLRLTGNTFWLEKADWKAFADYEAVVDNVIGAHRMLALCTYSLDKCGSFELLDVVRNHEFALIKQEGKWELMQSQRHRKAEEALRESEQRVRLKLQSVLTPEGDLGTLELADIIDAAAIQSLMDHFHELAHVPMAIIDLQGKVLVGSGWQDVCTKFHRVHPETRKHCVESDTQLSVGVAPGEFRLYKCRNNMWDIATPILVGGRHVGNLFAGQFFFDDEPVDYEPFRCQARRYSFDEQQYLAALETVPRLSREAVDAAMGFFIKLAEMLSLLSYSNIKLARSLSERDALIAERKEAEDALRATAEELARSNRDLEQFAYVASHDLQEPLRMVTGYLQLLRERYQGKLDDKADRYIGYAVDGAERMSGLIRDLLAYSRLNTRGSPLSPTSAEEALEIALKNLGRAVRESSATVTHDPLPEVVGDKTQLVQVFQNLIGNAIKFRAADRPPQVHVGVRQEPGHWEFSVEDNGIGFEQQYEHKLFLIFQRLHGRGQYPGTGIGLAICKRIVERHGGRMWAAGVPGEGSTFFFTIPFDADAGHARGADTTTAAGGPGCGGPSRACRPVAT